MKVNILSKTVDACDLCRQTGYYLEECVVCGKEYCHTREAIICGCIHQPKMCKRCAEIKAVRGVVDRFAPKLERVLKARDIAMKSAKP